MGKKNETHVRQHWNIPLCVLINCSTFINSHGFKKSDQAPFLEQNRRRE
uniref:Uncharacterized protein n=1 Tax=Anguilla anguilla TaxID=7936 RepID=A0A0E9PCP3_ANGAN